MHLVADQPGLGRLRRDLLGLLECEPEPIGDGLNHQTLIELAAGQGVEGNQEDIDGGTQRAHGVLGSSMRRRLLFTTALVPLTLFWAPGCAAPPPFGLVPQRDADGRVTAWINPSVLAALRERLGS